MVDIASNWWQGGVVVDRTQLATRNELDRLRHNWPFRIRELHPDNDSSLINHLLVQYCRKNQIALSRSRPLKKNDNCWVEQKNWTHVRKLVGLSPPERGTTSSSAPRALSAVGAVEELRATGDAAREQNSRGEQTPAPL